MDKEKILFWRNFLFRCFIIGVLIAIFLGLITLAFWNSLMTWAAELLGVEGAELREMTLQFFLDIRIVLVFLMLTPAIALHWMAKGK